MIHEGYPSTMSSRLRAIFSSDVGRYPDVLMSIVSGLYLSCFPPLSPRTPLTSSPTSSRTSKPSGLPMSSAVAQHPGNVEIVSHSRQRLSFILRSLQSHLGIHRPLSTLCCPDHPDGFYTACSRLIKQLQSEGFSARFCIAMDSISCSRADGDSDGGREGRMCTWMKRRYR